MAWLTYILIFLVVLCVAGYASQMTSVILASSVSGVTTISEDTTFQGTDQQIQVTPVGTQGLVFSTPQNIDTGANLAFRSINVARSQSYVPTWSNSLGLSGTWSSQGRYVVVHNLVMLYLTLVSAAGSVTDSSASIQCNLPIAAAVANDRLLHSNVQTSSRGSGYVSYSSEDQLITLHLSNWPSRPDGYLWITATAVYQTDSAASAATEEETEAFTVTEAVPEPFRESSVGPLVGTPVVTWSGQGQSVALSQDGSTMAVGGELYSSFVGGVWIFIRSGSTWEQQGSVLQGSDNTGNARMGQSVALSSDGNTVAFGGFQDDSNTGAVWVFTRSGSTWSQQGSKLVGTGGSATATQGFSVALSADGNTLASGGRGDDSNIGAVWIFTRSGSIWSQQGSKLVGSGTEGSLTYQGNSVSLADDGNTLAVGGPSDNSDIGATWVFVRSGSVWSQQGDKLIGSNGTTAQQGSAVSLGADGTTLAVGGPYDDYLEDSARGAVWIFTRAAGIWSQQGEKLVGAAGTTGALQGVAVALQGDTVAFAGSQDASVGSIWIFDRNGSNWSQTGAKITVTGNTDDPNAGSGGALTISRDAQYIAVGGGTNATYTGATWILTRVT